MRVRKPTMQSVRARMPYVRPVVRRPIMPKPGPWSNS